MSLSVTNQMIHFSIKITYFVIYHFRLPRGGVLSIFVRQGCAVFQSIVFTHFFYNRLSKKAVFLEPVVKMCHRGKFCQFGLLFLVQFLCFGVFSSPIFSGIGYHLKILEPGTKTFRGHIPVQILVKYPRGLSTKLSSSVLQSSVYTHYISLNSIAIFLFFQIFFAHFV